MEVEMSSIWARPPQPAGELATRLADDEEKSVRKSLEIVDGDTPAQSVQPIDIPATAVSASTPAMRRKARIQFVALCWTMFLAGWNDGTTGPLLPRIQRVYHVCFPTTICRARGWILTL